MIIKELQTENNNLFEWIVSFCNDYCKDIDDREEFKEKLGKYVQTEIELESYNNE